MTSLKLKDVCRSLSGGIIPISNFNLEVDEKELLVLVGPTGSGKSVILRMIAGLEEVTKGELYIGDKLVNHVAPKNRDIAMVSLNSALYPDMTVYDNIAFGLKLRQMPANEIEQRVSEAAELLEIEHLLDKQPKSLSDVESQKVDLGRAIVKKPKLYLMDDPLTNFDDKLRKQMRTEINKLHQKLQATFIYVTNSPSEAMAMGTKIVVMKDGCVYQIGTPQTIYEEPINMFVGGFIGSPEMNFISTKIKKRDTDIWLEFGKNSVKIPAGRAKKIENAGYIGKEVILGIRPEDIHDEEIYISSMPDAIVEAKVDVAEMMGSDTFLYMSINKINFTARVHPRTTAQSGTMMNVAFDVNKMHIF